MGKMEDWANRKIKRVAVKLGEVLSPRFEKGKAPTGTLKRAGADQAKRNKLASAATEPVKKRKK
jgi:hypothetical protein